MTAPIQRASLTQLTGGSATVSFQFNPGKVTIKQASNYVSRSGGLEAVNHQAAIRAVSATSVSLGDIVFAGPAAQQSVKQVLAWRVPVEQGFTAGEKTNVYYLPALRFAWGGSAGLDFTVFLTAFSFSYERFLSNGRPVRVLASLDMQEYDVPPSPQNPSSGGIPGRGRHTVVAEDNLPRIAQAAYGSPKEWRAIADANGIDDPLRLSWGRQLFLPARDELRTP
ncbi:LysM peptidoglycan-binding domain-containing protein [Amycolatopsis sp. cg5]|uniref:LysM peptidoglycan-binding domain-containing protein n=1 Tax=Amycolatopsis sp. cg5 TaxID=3238802 RepID=UPI0035258B5A